MTDNTAQDMMDALDDLLDQERRALIGGNLDKIARLLARKEDLIDGLNEIDGLSQVELGDLHGKVTRNQALLNSAMEGIRAVATRMANLRRVRKSLDTYDQAGNKHCIVTAATSTVEKRA